ncbi:IclR family transcriptional regulator [Planococcus shenhongbingii]|uniref:IclR family transcriptional regulator n=1 Tax=Planococcus shenhongbingii TaxID=3058398 RepID=A0ABT8NBQ5_9BACL|nr:MULTISPECIES: IclR family transcriptional regulator [unclassified Planococcus (in: firmicutes)]MDN7245321.1 IclR family transcriptional regulator [Planococcus sp. N017]WKA58426.1 IclR family transcriptional regulator [Planococcus sp. N016]
MSTKELDNFKKSGDHIQSLERGLQVIQAFSQHNSSMTVSDAAKKTGLSRPAARRILLTLEALGFAESKNGSYSLTARTLSLGYAYLSSNNSWSIAHPFLKNFVDQTGESCSISILDDMHILYVARVSTKRIMSINLGVGSRLPAYATSMGHVLLANLPQKELEAYLEKMDFEKYTDKTITDKEELLKVLEEVRQKNWGGVDQQFEEGLRSIAVPIRNAHGKVIAAMNCSVHAGRISEDVLREEFLPLLQEAAEQIGQALAAANSSSYEH